MAAKKKQTEAVADVNVILESSTKERVDRLVIALLLAVSPPPFSVHDIDEAVAEALKIVERVDWNFPPEAHDAPEDAAPPA